MQERLKSTESKFEKLTLSLKEYNECRINGSEVSINGKMYDVRSFEIKGDKIEMIALNDTEEENILQRIKDLITNNTSNPAGEVPSQLTDLMDIDYVNPCNGVEITFYQKDQQKFKELYQSHSSFQPDVLSPPPRLV